MVQDTGVGIAPAALDKLFVPYSALPNQGRSRGTGLGLAICKQLVELMDASGRGIWVKSQLGKGSEFGFELAFNECDMTYASEVKERVLVPARQVLVIEDNKVNAMVAQGFLAHLGHQSVLAISCQQALALIESSGVAFDAVMLDIQLSDGSGIDLLPQLKMLIANPSVKFAAFTAQMQSEDLQHYREAGFDTVLAKPLSLQTLTEWLGVAVSPLSASIASSTDNKLLSAPRVTAEAKLAAAIADVDNEPLLDLKQLAQDKDVLGSEAMMSMFDLFSDSSREQLAKLSVANPKEDAAKLLHALKGSSASMGLIALAKLCKELELVLKGCADNASTDNALELIEFQRLESCWQASIAALSQWLGVQNE